MNCKRVITWIFWVANVCLLLVVILLAMARKVHGAGLIVIGYDIVMGVVVPLQLILATIWVCTNRGGYLIRGLWLTVFVILACLGACYFTYKPANVLHAYLLFYITQVLTICYGFHVASKWGLLRGGYSKEKPKKRRFQISLKTMLGWTTIVAIFAYGFSYTSSHQRNFRELHSIWTVVPILTVLTVSTVVLLDRKVAWWRRWGSLPILALVLVLAVLAVLFNSSLHLDNYVYLAYAILPAQLYLAIGYSVQRQNTFQTPMCISTALNWKDKIFHPGIVWTRENPTRVFLVNLLALLLLYTAIISLYSYVFLNP